MLHPVYLAKHPDYSQPRLDRAVGDLFDACLKQPGGAPRILVKPNMVTAKNARLSCTHPAVVLAVCRYFCDLGATVSVGDSPAFGSTRYVAAKSGYEKALGALPITLENFDKGVRTRFAAGFDVHLARQALNCDLLVNVPKLKAHVQMRLTCCVKNLFGCVVGLRKALFHTRLGRHPSRFSEMILEIGDHLPATIHVVDGIEAMHILGPINGRRLDFGLLGLAANGIAMDTAVSTALSCSPGQVPLWREARRQKRSGAWTKQLKFPLLEPHQFAGRQFVLPAGLKPISFNPFTIIRGSLRRLGLNALDKLRS